MTTPTPAQIEAAEDWFTLSPRYRTKEKLIEMLTAAAEVGEPKDNTDLAGRLLEAQISNVDPENHKTILRRWHWEIAQEINSTIERCAQVVESFHNHTAQLAPVAAAIRALKDKP